MHRRHLTAILMLVIIALAGCSDDKKPTDSNPANEIIPLHGVRYRGLMGASSFDQPLQFAVTDNDGDYIAGQQILVELVEGDGATVASIVAGSDGIAVLPFTFSGVLPYATVRLYVPDVDELEIEIRADAILPGPDGQVSLVRFGDRYSDVKAWLGEPDREDAYPSMPDVRIIYAVWEDVRGVVVMLYDLDKDNTFYDTSSVYGVIVNSVYGGRTIGANPVGIDSSMAAVRARFGTPDYISSAGTNEIVFGYQFWGLTGYAVIDGADTSMTELQFSEYVVRPDEIVPLHGIYLKGTTWGGLLRDTVVVEDADDNRVGNVVLDLNRIEGDGTYSGNNGTNSIETDPTTGKGAWIYSFNGYLGHAILRITLPEVDTVDLYLRANVLVPGANGQGQYALFGDTYDDVRNWNGDALSIESDGPLGSQYLYADYGGGVTLLYHNTGSNQINDTSTVAGIIAVEPYTGRTREGVLGIRIASTWAQMITTYGDPTDTVAIADTLQATYDGLPARFDLLVSGIDTTIARILLWEP